MSEINSMVFYKSWYETASDEGEEFRNKIINQILRYGFYGEIPDNTDDGMARIMFKDARPLIDANIKKRVDGAKGGRPKKEKNHTKTTGLSNVDVDVDADANVDADADTDKNVNEDAASVSSSHGSETAGADEYMDINDIPRRT